MIPNPPTPQEPAPPQAPSDRSPNMLFNRISKRVFWGTAAARGIALFLAVFSLLNLAIEYRQMGDPAAYKANEWWIDFHPLPDRVGHLVLVWVSTLFLAYGLAPAMAPWRRRTTRTTIELLGLIIAWRIVNYYGNVLHGRIHTVLAVPLTLFIGMALAGVWLGARNERPASGPRAWVAVVGMFVACAVLFPLLQMICFGLRDYRRPADVAVVFGARVYADGTPSDALADRVRTAVELYRHDPPLVGKLIFSGGPGDGAIYEADAMRALALKEGVGAQDILIDRSGLNTDATVRNTMPMLAKLANELGRPPIVIAVSHFYHLPRVKMRFANEGRNVLTVPARQPLAHTLWFMFREVPALWLYYFESLVK